MVRTAWWTCDECGATVDRAEPLREYRSYDVYGTKYRVIIPPEFRLWPCGHVANQTLHGSAYEPCECHGSVGARESPW